MSWRGRAVATGAASSSIAVVLFGNFLSAISVGSVQVLIVAPAIGGILRATRLMEPENENTGFSADVSMPRRKTMELPARVISARPSIISPSRTAARNSQANDKVTPGPSRIGAAVANRQ